MKYASPSIRGVAAGLFAITALTVSFVSSVQPAPAAVTGACDGQIAEQPFEPWLDPASYVLVRNGTVEIGAGWSLQGGAARTLGSEAFYVHDEHDVSSLALPPGSSATTAPMCVGVEHPTLRLFARNRGSALSSLLVEVLFKDATGQSRAAPIGALSGTSSWQPTVPLAVLANLFSVPAGEHVDVSFRFTPTGAGDWSIDDVYVDPFRHG